MVVKPSLSIDRSMLLQFAHDEFDLTPVESEFEPLA